MTSRAAGVSSQLAGRAGSRVRNVPATLNEIVQGAALQMNRIVSGPAPAMTEPAAGYG